MILSLFKIPLEQAERWLSYKTLGTHSHRHVREPSMIANSQAA
jgi:hypothetical protein